MTLQSSSTQRASSSTGMMSTSPLPTTISSIVTSTLTRAAGNSTAQATSISAAVSTTAATTTIAENTTSKTTMSTTSATSESSTSAASGSTSLPTEIANINSSSTAVTPENLINAADSSTTDPENRGFWHYLQKRMQNFKDYLVEHFRGLNIRFLQAKKGSLVLKFVTLENFDKELLKNEPVEKKLRDMIKAVCPEYQELLKEPVHVTIFLKPKSNTDNAEIYFHLETSSEMKEKEECSQWKIESRDKRYMVEEMNPTSLKNWLFNKLQLEKETQIQLVDLVSWKDISRRGQMKILLSTVESLENGYKLLENYCEENNTLVYDKVFKKHRQMTAEKNTKAAQLSGFSSEEEGLQMLSSTWIDFTVNPKGEDFEKTVGASQE